MHALEQVLDAVTGKVKRKFGKAQLSRASVFGLALSSKFCFVCNGSRVCRYAQDGTFIDSIGEQEANGAAGQLQNVWGVAVDEPSNSLFASDFSADCIAVYDMSSGAFMRKIGSEGSGNGQLLSPNGVTV